MEEVQTTRKLRITDSNTNIRYSLEVSNDEVRVEQIFDDAGASTFIDIPIHIWSKLIEELNMNLHSYCK